jgi:large subunit ribosomal protein L21
MYAVVESGGKQYRVAEGDVVTVERLSAAAGEEVVFDRVLAIGGEGQLRVGTPYLPGARVFGRVLEQTRQRKIRGLKYKAKVNYRRRYGHRQQATRVRITAIAPDGRAPAVAESAAG